MLKIQKLSVVTALGLMTIGTLPVAHAVNIVDEPNTKAVGHVVWHKQANIDPQDLLDKAVPKDSTSLFFIRRYDNDPEQTSANIAVNDRFQVSLHPGNYTQVYSCAGINRLSAEATGLKTNDLLQDVYPYTLEAGGTYFFYVDVDAAGNSEIQQITRDSALEVLENKAYQTHQITRVVPNCPPAPVVVVQPKPKPVAPPALVLEQPVSIELKVLFDNDKAIIKPQYFQEVKDVADFMQKYPNTTAVIEGHTDSNASDSYNQKLSQRRADAVMQMLTAQYGIGADRLTAVGYGEARPVASNATSEGRQQNRRVIAVISERQ